MKKDIERRIGALEAAKGDTPRVLDLEELERIKDNPMALGLARMTKSDWRKALDWIAENPRKLGDPEPPKPEISDEEREARLKSYEEATAQNRAWAYAEIERLKAEQEAA